MSRKARNSEGCTIDMTPMIDVVFQMIIFFIVTITISEAKDKEVVLEYGPNGEIVNNRDKTREASVLIIDVGEKGRISVNNVVWDDNRLYSSVKRRAETRSSFQVWIRGDYRVTHAHIKHVMDICSSAGVGRIHIISVKDPRTPETKRIFDVRKIQWR